MTHVSNNLTERQMKRLTYFFWIDLLWLLCQVTGPDTFIDRMIFKIANSICDVHKKEEERNIEKAKEFFQQNESWLGDIIRKESRKDPEFKEWLRSRDIRSTLPATLSGFEVLTRSDSEDSPSSS